MAKKTGEDNFSVLDEEKKAQILKNLDEEIERQKAKYCLAGSRVKESNEFKIEDRSSYYNPQKQFDQNSYNNHIDMLESAKDNLKKIQSDIKNMSNSNYAYSFELNTNDNKANIANKTAGYDNYELNDEEEHSNVDSNKRKYQLEDEGEAEAENNQMNFNQYQDQHQSQQQQMVINDNNYNLQSKNDPNVYHDRNMYNSQTKDKIEGEVEANLVEEEPKNLEHEMSVSNHNYTSYNNSNNDNNNYGNEYIHINTNQSNTSNQNMNKASSYSNSNRDNKPIKSVGGYNFFNPIDYNPNQHKGIATYNSNSAIMKKSNSREKDIYSSRDKSFDYDSNYKLKKEKQEDRTRSPYFKRISKLYTPKYKSKEKYEIMKKELETKFNKDHPFKPEIAFTVQPKIPNESNQQRFDRLSQPKTIEIEQRMKKKEQMTQENINNTCNYKPMTNNHQSSSCQIVNPTSISNKLFKLHDQLKEKKEKMKRDYEDNKIKEYSFAPEINKESKMLMQKYDKRPIYERSEDYERTRNENLLKMRQEIEREQLAYYKPVINEKSKELANKKTSQSTNEIGDIHEKLYRENIRNEKHKHGNPQLEECTFNPKLYYDTYDNDGGNIDDFLERQKIYEQLKKERLEKKAIKSEQNNDYTFAPKINLTSDILMKTNSLRANEAIEDKIDRLYKQDYEEMQRRKDQLQSFYNAQFDFKPKINELSRFIGRDASINDLHQKSVVQEKMNKSQMLVNDNECTFKPNINKEKYNHIQSSYKADEEIFNRINDEMMNKKQKITGMQSVIEKRKDVECKFKPEINHEVPNFETKEPMLMKGMAKHLEQMEKARKAKREKEEREKEVFITGDNWSRDNLITVPKPFKLSFQYQQKKVDNSIKKAKDIEMKECTFKPLTNESKNREIIKQLLKD